MDENYKPRIAILVPTYREVELIHEKLDNLYDQDYPKDVVEVIIVDSASDDGTIDRIDDWKSFHPDFNLKLFEETKRLGMVRALNNALHNYPIDSEIILFTDVDAFWDKDALKKISKYFADQKVGAVTGSIIPMDCANNALESTYRQHYNIIRIAESKVYGTPMHNGPLVAFRTNLLYRIGGLLSYTGLNDCAPASMIAFMGYRAIQADDIIVREPLRGRHFSRKIRRAQHVLLTFLMTKRYAKDHGLYASQAFDTIWKMEWWFHLGNPWLLATSALLLLTSIALNGSIISLVFLGMSLLLMVSSKYRTWMMQQIYLAVGAIKNIWTKDTMWNKNY